LYGVHEHTPPQISQGKTEAPVYSLPVATGFSARLFQPKQTKYKVNTMKPFKYVSIFVLISTTLIAQNINISGNAFLDEQSDHSGIKVYFEPVSPSAIEDSAFTNSAGAYSKNVAVGIYNVHFLKDGYQPKEIPNQFFSETTVLPDVTMPVGTVVYISGAVSGLWEKTNIYIITNEINVAAGNTLTIQPGTQVKFNGNYSLTVYGTLIADGAPGDSIIFTTNQSVPMPGDWGSIILQNSNNSVLDHIKYLYASNGINGLGNQSLSVTITNSLIDNLHTDAYAIKLGNGGENSLAYGTTIIKYNTLKVAGDWVLYAPCAQQEGKFIGNNIISTDGSGQGAYLGWCVNAIVDSNTFDLGFTTGHGLYAYDSDNIKVRNNSLTGRMVRYCYQLQYSDNAIIKNNSVTLNDDSNWNNEKYGFYLRNCTGDSIINNIYHYFGNSYYNYAFGLSGSSNHYFKNNYIKIEPKYGENHYWYGFGEGSNHLFINNKIIINHINTSNASAFHNVSNSLIKDNYIEVTSRTSDGVWGTAIYGNGNTIINDTLILGESTKGIWGNNLTIKDVIIQSPNANSNYEAIHLTGSNNIIENVDIISTGKGIYMESASNTQVKYNTIKVHGSDYGIHVNSNSTPIVFKNSILGNDNGTGIKVENNSMPFLRNNHIQDFTTGISATSLTSVCQYNNVYNVSTPFSGSGLPPSIGLFVTQNRNNVPSDIYWNIRQAPNFYSEDPEHSQYLEIMGNSALVNAGYPDSLDADGTVSDIGKDSYFHYLVIKHTKLASTNNTTGPYTVKARIFSPVGNAVQTATLYYSTDGGDSYSSVSMTKATADTFQADIPGQALNTSIYYYIEATDGEHTLTDPFDVQHQTYSFIITMFSEFANLSGTSNTDGSIHLIWNSPVPINGNLIGYRLYRAGDVNVPISNDYLYVSLEPAAVSYTDNNVEEGFVYYYKLTGIIDDNGNSTEALASAEISVISDNPTIVRIKGTVLLEDASDHSGIKIFFEKTSPSAVSDSCYTESNGGFNKILKTGIYNVHMSKDGYQPKLIGDQFFPGNVTMDTVILVLGGVVKLSGDVSGILTSNNLYFVDGNITIPEGKSLTIKAGTQVLFRGNYSLTANGRLYVNGTLDNKVIFSSRMPVPATGDWQNIVLNSGADSSQIMNTIYKYASNGIQCNGVSPITIHGMEINTLSISARGISLSNCHGIDICYNNIQVAGDWVIYKSDYDDQNARYIGNVISGTNQGMRIPYSKHAICDSNKIVLGKCDGSGIYALDSDDMKMRYNAISGDYIRYGIFLQYADNVNLISNNIDLDNPTEWNDEKYGYYLTNCSGDSVLDNKYSASGVSYYYYAYYLNNSTNHYFENNYIKIEPKYGENYYWYGFGYGSNHTFIKNTIIINHSLRSRASAFYNISNSLIKNNYIEVTSRMSNSDWGTAIYGNGNTLIGDTLVLGETTRGVWGNDLTIKDVVIQSTNANNALPAIYCTGGVLNIQNVKIQNCYDGIYGSGAGGTIRNNLINVYGSFGTRFENNADMLLYQNTLVGNNTGVGIDSKTNSTITINSCIVNGFANGAIAESPQKIQTSLFYDNTSHFSGSALPAQVGETITVNSNADPSDIYGNIVMDPLFVDVAMGDYNLQVASPAINAGDIDSLDVDGTVADIGAYPYNFGFVPQSLVVDSTGNGFVAISWEIEVTDSLSGYQPYYKLSSGSEWIKASQTNDLNYTFSGLTNNVGYDLCVTANYQSKESLKSRKISSKAGLAVLDISPRYIVGIQESEEPLVVSFDLTNNGTKDLNFNLFTTEIESSQLNLSLQNGTIAPSGSVAIHDTLYGNSEYLTTQKIFVETNNLKQPLDSLEILFINGIIAPLDVSHFTPVAATSKSFYVVVDKADIDGTLLQTGDEIALFDGETCVGAAGYNGSFPFVFPVYGTDGASPGFTAGDSISIQIWDSRHLQYATCQITISSGSSTFQPGGFAITTLSGTIYKTIQIPITANRFNLISSHLYPRNLQIQSIFGNLPGLKILYQDDGSAYIPQYNINSIGDLNICEGYHLFVEGSDQILTIEGLNITPENWQITLNANQFNSIANLYSAPVDVAYAFNSITDQVEIIQNDAGGAWIPSLSINTIGNLQPNSGYQVFTNATEDILFTYPAPAKGLAKETDDLLVKFAQPSHFIYTETGLPYLIVITSAIMDNQILENGDEIGVYFDNLCVGSIVWEKDKKIVLPAWRGDKTQDIPGFKSNGLMTFRAYSKRFQKEFEMSAKYQNSDQAYFEKNAFSLVSLRGEPGLIPRKFALKQNYPNPFNATTVIPYDIATETAVTIIIYNLRGEEIYRLMEDQSHIPGRYTIPWNGNSKNNSILSSGIYFVQLITEQYHATKKVILLK